MSTVHRRFATRPASRPGPPLCPPPVPLALAPLARTRRKPPLGTGIWAPPLLALLLASAAQAQQTATVSGVVVDAATNQPISGVEVRVEGLDLLAVSGGDGGFSLEGVPIRELRLVFRHLGYGEHAETVSLDQPSGARFRVRMSQQAIELTPLEVQVSATDQRFRAGGNPGNAIDAAAIAAADMRGLSLMETLRREVPGIRVRTVAGGSSCLEYRLLAGGFPIGGAPDSLSSVLLGVDRTMNTTCRGMAVFLDGVRVQESASFLLQMPLSELERIEVLSASEGSIRYGSAAGAGVLVLYSKQGMVPETPLEPARRVTGFRWQEAEPYGWPRVLATSFLTSAATLGLLYVALGSCFEERDAGLGPDFACDSGPPAIAAGLLTGTVVAFSTRWAGGSSLSNGWALPSLGLGSVSSIAGYLLLIKGETTESSGARTAGLGVLALGTPLVVALADRVFRVLR